MDHMPLVIATEYHSYGAPVVDGAVQTSHASLYIVRGVDANQIDGIYDMETDGASYVRIAERINLQDAKDIVDILLKALSNKGLKVNHAEFYDE